MKNNKGISRRINQSVWIAVLAAVITIGMGIWIVGSLPVEGTLLIFGSIFYLILSVIYTEYLGRITEKKFREAGLAQNQVQHSLVQDLPVPFLLTDSRGNVRSYNTAFRELFRRKLNKRNVCQMFPEIHAKILPPPGTVRSYQLTCEDVRFRVETRCILMDEKPESGGGEQEEAQQDYLIAFYFYDVTMLMEYQEDSRRRSLVAGLIYIDNYEEVLEGMEDVRQSLLLALVERKIIKYMQGFRAITKKFEKDKFIFFIEEQYLQEMKDDKFPILDEVREINIGNSLNMTLSIGVGVNEEHYADLYESARIAMDLALGRGGDQAAVRNRDSISYYGGKSQKVEKTTRVKARVKAHALREIMMAHDRVLIMGHKKPDADCIGAALGIYSMAESMDKEVYLVLDRNCPDIEPIVIELLDGNTDNRQIFLSNEEALGLNMVTTMLVVVDVNIPTMTECPGLLQRVRTTVVLDHHLSSSETIRGTVVSYVEHYASSTCEMVTEILQYVTEKPRLKPIYADALYAGILVDTDNFAVNAGVRTFEAAAFLRRAGADIGRVRKMFREDFNHTKITGAIINRTELFLDEFAISSQDGRAIKGATIIGAKAANSLLNIQGIRASFVLTELNDQIYISARSIDDVNCQVIMEHFGGGGHMTAAAAQIRDKSLSDVDLQLKELLTSMREKGDL